MSRPEGNQGELNSDLASVYILVKEPLLPSINYFIENLMNEHKSANYQHGSTCAMLTGQNFWNQWSN